MPIYEFYCPDCHTVFSFFSSRIDTEAQPACPRCGRSELPRKPSSFATLKHGEDSAEDAALDGLDDQRLEKAVDTLMQEMGGVDEDDPRAMGKMMRRFSDVAGLEMGEQLSEMVVRLERGEDPEALEKEMGNSLDAADAADQLFQLKKAVRERRARPRVDEELYFL